MISPLVEFSQKTYTQKAMDGCIFCEVISGELPSKKVFEDDEILAFYDIHPKAPVHVIIVSKKHLKGISEATRDDQALLGKIQLVASQIAKDLKISEAFKLTTNNGEGAGQVIPHLHYHLIGGWNSKKDVVSELGL